MSKFKKFFLTFLNVGGNKLLDILLLSGVIRVVFCGKDVLKDT